MKHQASTRAIAQDSVADTFDQETKTPQTWTDYDRYIDWDTVHLSRNVAMFYQAMAKRERSRPHR